MQTVFTNSMTAHVWAQQSQARARNGTGSLFFEYDTIYSYGYHFPVACFAETPSGVQAVYVTTDRYSSTTAGHVSLADHAIPDGIQIFRLPSALWNKPSEAMDYYRDKIDKKYATARRARRWLGMERIADLIGEANDYARLHRLDDTVISLADDHDSLAARESIAMADYRESRKPKSTIERLRDTHKAYIAWRAGNRATCPSAWAKASDTHLLAYDAEADIVRTSGGASFPGRHARRAMAMVAISLGGGVSSIASIPLGHFKIDSIDAQCIRAGCHRVSKRGAMRLIRRLRRSA